MPVYILTPKQKLFWQHYQRHWNATRAAEAAGYSWPNKAGPRVSHSPKLKPLIEAWHYAFIRALSTPDGRRPSINIEPSPEVYTWYDQFDPTVPEPELTEFQQSVVKLLIDR